MQHGNMHTTYGIMVIKGALPVALGYIPLGIAAGILSAKAGMNIVQVFLLGFLMYSGSGQFMIANLLMAGTGLFSICLSTSMVSARQLLYASAFTRFFEKAPKPLSLWFFATVTDESFGVNLVRFQSGRWGAWPAIGVNVICHLSWTFSTLAGALVGEAFDLPTTIASFAMTSIFICLLMSQRFSADKVVAAGSAVLGVILCKTVGPSELAILFGAVFGVVMGMLYRYRDGSGHETEEAFMTQQATSVHGDADVFSSGPSSAEKPALDATPDVKVGDGKR